MATVVALRSLGLAIGDSLTGNVRSSIHGDIALDMSSGGGFNFNGTEDTAFTTEDVAKVEAWAKEHNATVSASTQAGNLQVTALNFESVGRPQFITTYFIDPQTYPPTADIRTTDPSGAAFSEIGRASCRERV